MANKPRIFRKTRSGEFVEVKSRCQAEAYVAPDPDEDPKKAKAAGGKKHSQPRYGNLDAMCASHCRRAGFRSRGSSLIRQYAR